MISPRTIDPTYCWVRHIRRGTAAEVGNVAIARVRYVPNDVDGINGRSGWQTAEAALNINDDGTFTLTLPNAAGGDGVLHRRRFAIYSDPGYQPGEEWLEFYRDAGDLILVGTPTDATKGRSTLTITGSDLGVVLEGARGSDVDVWEGNAPIDVVRHYARLPVLAIAEDNLGSLTGAPTTFSALTRSPSSVEGDCWECEARLRWTSQNPDATSSNVRLDVGGIRIAVDVADGDATLTGPAEVAQKGKRVGLVAPGTVALRLVARYERIFAFVEGELVGEYRRQSMPSPTTITVDVRNGTAVVDALSLEYLAKFAERGAQTVDRRLPGLPPATGLRARYWNAAPTYAQFATRDGRNARLWPLVGETEPIIDRLEPTVDYPVGSTSWPPGMAGAYAARWVGAIYLDLAASERRIRLDNLDGYARLYVGRTLRGVDEIASTWQATAATEVTTGVLRPLLGTKAGWFPIVLEMTDASATPGVRLLDSATDSGGSGATFAVVPTTRLSPIGAYEEHLRNEQHRTVIGDVADTFGMQWRVEPRQLESGEFPGQIIAAPRIGRDTEVVITDGDVGADVEVQVNAKDVVGGMLADAAGIADPKGSGQLTAHVIDRSRALSKLYLRQDYEQLAEISEQPLLVQRLSTLLALRGSPNEQVGVRPSGQRDLVDTFPLTGALARMDWAPGDGVRLDLDSVDVRDATPRQMTGVTWPLRPDGVGVPTTRYRDRPRSVAAALRKLRRVVYAAGRNYQGGTAIVTGSPGSTSTTTAPDGYTRVPAPRNLDDVVRVVLVVRVLTGSGWRMEISGVDLGVAAGAVPAPDRYDVTDTVALDAGTQQFSARLIGGTGVYQISLELHVRV